MRKMILVLVLSTMCTIIFAQSVSSRVAFNYSYSENSVFLKHAEFGNYDILNPPGLRMRNTGRTLTILGSALFVGGAIIFGSADEKYYNSTTTNYGTTTEGDPKAAVGILMMVGGAGMAVPGIIFWSKGSKKYKSHLESEGQAASIQFRSNGLSLHYRF
ncbi:MAG: hypothetical protein ABI663_16215 [Chryseolinea sp.]